ncbi:Mad3/BUB1 homology region 1 [Popillia japonica]|uniref:Mad3/BUB1 homology region 1 n=1 Tax=Popillia japonica TaxID=7064 RepID=A0AAW1KHG6_POPJA
MDFDLSKENIQPLRGGRNASQLVIALQAQNNNEYQRELLQQKEVFENAIRSYTGDDPLENWYNYISWVEQSYPKHGYEGNLRTLLEDCLTKFEHDSNYTNDRRFCKLWVKFIDYHENPLDLYHMLYTKGIGRGCSDLYKAWAYYYEVVGDYKSADLVFQRGARELAQPFDDLMAAHQNMIYAAGQQVIKGVDKGRLEEQRQALTSLRSYRHCVGSIRTPSSSSAGTLSSKQQPKSNVPVVVYESNADCIQGAEVAPMSVMSIARRDEGSKENLLKSGPWTTVANCKAPVTHRFPPITIHEDSEDIHHRGLILPADFVSFTREDLSNFKANLVYPEPADPKIIPKYPKALVYAEEDTEYSLEEIKSRDYLARSRTNTTGFNYETEQAIQSILDDKPVSTGAIHKSPYKFPEQLHQSPHYQQNVDYQLIQDANQPVVTYNNIEHNHIPLVFAHDQENPSHLLANYGEPKMNLCSRPLQLQPQPLQPQQFEATFGMGSPHHQLNSDAYIHPISMDTLWRSPLESHNESIYGDTGAVRMSPKGASMKTPIKILSDDDLAETGSRGGLDIAAAAQPVDSAIINLDDDTNSSYGDAMPYQGMEQGNYDISSTQAFNFNLTSMKVSTPLQDRLSGSTHTADVESSKKQLFHSEQKALSTILEETKSYGTSSSGSSLGTQSRKINNTNLTVEQNSYSSNLAQNLKANAALRSSLLGEYMDCQSQQTSPITELPPPIPAVKPTNITPLTKAPSDPFQRSLIQMLLERINFPGQHTYGYRKIATVPRLNVKKEIVVVGENRYFVEKILGKGTYGSVFKAVDWHTKEIVALKFQKPANKWEFYICRELQARLADHPLKDKFMDVSIGFYNKGNFIKAKRFFKGEPVWTAHNRPADNMECRKEYVEKYLQGITA